MSFNNGAVWRCSAWMAVLRELKAGPGQKGKVWWLLLQLQRLRCGTKNPGPNRTVQQGRVLPGGWWSCLGPGGLPPMLLGWESQVTAPQFLPSLGSCDCKEEPAPHQLGWESHVPQVENWLRVAWRLLLIGYFFLSADGTNF